MPQLFFKKKQGTSPIKMLMLSRRNILYNLFLHTGKERIRIANKSKFTYSNSLIGRKFYSISVNGLTSKQVGFIICI